MWRKRTGGLWHGWRSVVVAFVPDREDQKRPSWSHSSNLHSEVDATTILFPVAVARGFQSAAPADLLGQLRRHGIIRRGFGTGDRRRCGFAWLGHGRLVKAE